MLRTMRRHATTPVTPRRFLGRAPSPAGNRTSKLGAQEWLNSEPSRYSAEPTGRPAAPLAPATAAAASAAKLRSRVGPRAVSTLPQTIFLNGLARNTCGQSNSQCGTLALVFCGIPTKSAWRQARLAGRREAPLEAERTGRR